MLNGRVKGEEIVSDILHTFAVLKTEFLQSGRMLTDQGGKL